ncbi:hypothetical protein Tco_0234012, partial [Tanacetum coccineum]
TFKEPSLAHQHFLPPQEHAQVQMTVDDLLQLVPQLMTRFDSLEKDLKQTKLIMGSAIVKLVKKVKKLEEEEELNEQQKKRRAQVKFEAQHYTDEDWDLIRAKIEANAELSKSVLGSGL